jgi:DNA-binding CsgD family transcriptional regulator
VSADTFLAGVRRSLSSVDDDRVMRRAVLEYLRRAVPFDAFAWVLTDPETTVGTAPLAEVPCPDRLPHLVALRYTSGRRWTTADPGVPFRPVRPGSELGHFIAGLGSYEVVSLVFADRFGWWGFLDLWREGGRFDRRELQLLGLLGEPVTAALRESRAAAFLPPCTAAAQQAADRAVLLLGPDLSLRRQTAEAESRLRALLPTGESRRPVPAAAYNVGAQLLAVEAGIDAHPPRARAPVGAGEWICVEAARLGDDSDDDIAVTIGPVDQRERRSLFCRAHRLSERETEVVHHLADGDDTRTLAARLYLSEHTVQDHLRSVFAKTGVRSRRELLALVRGR